MEQNSISFSVQMKAMELFQFKLYHVYHGFSGVVGILLTLIAAVMLAVDFKNMVPQSRAVMILVILWFVVIDPLRFLANSGKQMKLNKVYQEQLQYQLDESGITVSQNETTQTIGWDNLVKIVETKHQFIVYSSKIHAFIFPKQDIGAQCDLMRKVLVSYGTAKRITMKGLPRDAYGI